MPKIVFTSPILEHPAAGGPQLRIENSIKALARISELHIISRVAATDIGEEQDLAHIQGFAKNFLFSPSVSGKSRRLPFRKRLLRKLGLWTSSDPVEKDAAFIAEYVQQISADVLWFGFGNISFPLIEKLRPLLPNVKFVCDTDSVWSRFILRELEVEGDAERRRAIEQEGRVKEVEEKCSVALCNVTTAVSEIDADYYRSIVDDASRIHIFSNVIDLDSYTERPEAPDSFHRPALFLGGSYYAENSPMVYAAKWTVAKVMPLVWRRFPETHLYLVGRGSEVYCRDLTGKQVHCTGRVISVLPYLCNSIASLVPLAFESGTRFKILESGACGKAVVSTSLGAEGIPVTHMRDCLIADTPEDFASAICLLLEGPEKAQKLGAQCRELVRRAYSIDVLAREAGVILDYVAKAIPRP